MKASAPSSPVNASSRKNDAARLLIASNTPANTAQQGFSAILAAKAPSPATHTHAQPSLQRPRAGQRISSQSHPPKSEKMQPRTAESKRSTDSNTSPTRSNQADKSTATPSVKTKKGDPAPQDTTAQGNQLTEAAAPAHLLAEALLINAPQVAETAGQSPDVAAKIAADIAAAAENGTDSEQAITVTPMMMATNKTDTDETASSAFNRTATALLTAHDTLKTPLESTAETLPDATYLTTANKDSADLSEPLLRTSSYSADTKTLAEKPLEAVSPQRTPAVQMQSASSDPVMTAMHAAQTITPAAQSQRANVPQIHIYTPANQKNWAEDIQMRLSWMNSHGEGKADLVLTPPSLGKLGVSLQVQNDQTTATFVAATPAAKEVLEQALPRLRELLQQSGIALGQANVSTSQQQQQSAHSQQHSAFSASPGQQQDTLTGEHHDSSVMATDLRQLRSSLSMVDIFA